MTDSILRSYQYSSSINLVPFVPRINLNEKSQAFDDTTRWNVTNATVTANSLTAPDGTATAEDVLTTATNGALNYKSPFTAFSASTTGTASIFIRAITAVQWFEIQIGESQAPFDAARAWFDVLNGVKGSTAVTGGAWIAVSSGIQSAGGGWYRCVLTFTTGSQAIVTQDYLLASADGVHIGGASGAEFGIWGAQLQYGSVATEYQANL